MVKWTEHQWYIMDYNNSLKVFARSDTMPSERDIRLLWVSHQKYPFKTNLRVQKRRDDSLNEIKKRRRIRINKNTSCEKLL